MRVLSVNAVKPMVAQRWCFSNGQLKSMGGCTNRIFSENLLSGRILSPCIWGTKQAAEKWKDTTGICTNEAPWNCRHARFNYSSLPNREKTRERERGRTAWACSLTASLPLWTFFHVLPRFLRITFTTPHPTLSSLPPPLCPVVHPLHHRV